MLFSEQQFIFHCREELYELLDAGTFIILIPAKICKWSALAFLVLGYLCAA